MVAFDPAAVQAWSAVAIAVLTAVLVGVTIAYVVHTAHLAKYARESAQSAERLLLLESMPVVIPQPGSGSSGGGTKTIHVTLTNKGRHAAVNASVRVSGQGGLELGPKSVPPISPDQVQEVPFAGPHDALPFWNEGALSAFTIHVDYRDAIGNWYRVAHSFLEATWELEVTRYREGKWESLTFPPI
jgi:hypothetical protein